MMNLIRWPNIFDEMAFGIDFSVCSTAGHVSWSSYKAQIQITPFL